LAAFVGGGVRAYPGGAAAGRRDHAAEQQEGRAVAAGWMGSAGPGGWGGAAAAGRGRAGAAAPLPGAVGPDGHGLRGVAARQAAEPAAVVGAGPAAQRGGTGRGGEPDGTGGAQRSGPAVVAGAREGHPGHDPAVHVLAAGPGGL